MLSLPPGWQVKPHRCGPYLIREVLSLRDKGVTPCERVLALVDRKLEQLAHHIRALAEFREDLAALRSEAVPETPEDGCVCGLIEHHEPRHEADSIRLATELLSHRPGRHR